MGWSHSLLSLIEVRYNALTQLCILELASFALVVIEIWVNFPAHSEILRYFSVWGRGSGNNFLGSGAMPL